MLAETEPRRAAAPRGLKTAGIVALVIALAVVAFGLLSRSRDVATAQNWSAARAIPTVHLIAATAGAADNALTLPGTMRAFNSARLYARVGGYLKAWYADIGTKVHAGTPLARIDTPELDQQIIQARADLGTARAGASLASSTAQRWNDLLKTASVSRQEADEKNGDLAVKQSLVKASQANLNRLLALKSFATLTAPFAGLVTARETDVGDLINAGQGGAHTPLFTVADVHRIRVYVSVPQSASANLRPGLAARLTVPDFPGRVFDARVIGTAGAIDGQSGTLLVQLLADNPDGALKPGGFAEVKFDVPTAAGVEIASSALIFRKAGIAVATVTPDDHVHMQPISLGRDLGGTVEVRSGLAVGDRVIDNPPDSLADGELVRVVEARHG